MTNPYLLHKQSEQLVGWLSTPLGNALRQSEQDWLNQVLPKLRGYHLLSLGTIVKENGLQSSPILHQVAVYPEQDNKTILLPAVRSLYQTMPFSNDSLDVVIMPHILEFQSTPQAILQEAWRILIPEGHLVLFCFNRYSLWGLKKLLKHYSDTVPWRGQFFSQHALKKYLTELNFEITQMGTLFFRPPLEQTYWLKKLQFIEKLGQLCCTHWGGVTFILAKKKVLTLTPIKPCWSKKEVKITSRRLEPTTQSIKFEAPNEKS